MLSERVRDWTQGIRSAIARVLGGWGVSPNTLTLFGYLLHLPAMVLLATGHLQLGGALFIVASAFDALDGSVAREMGQATTFGAFLDSVLDRFSEGTVLFGLLLHFLNSGARLEPALIYVAMFGSLLVSYTRARAEGIGIVCKEGLFTRFERVILLAAGLILGFTRPVLWLLATLTVFTALQRIAYVWRKANHG
jgi:CDP-diacylglycerol--glycerol-3-phosphate 3-phosphatidyltransferase